MRLTVGTKLWLSFFGTLTFTVLAMYLLLHSSLKQSFLDHTSKQAVQRLTILQEALLEIHRTEGSFQHLQDSPTRWLALKSTLFPKNAPSAGDPLDDSGQHYYRDFVTSISLFDQHKQLLIGVIKANKNLSWIPIVDEGAMLGFIAFRKPEIVARSADQRFITHQLKLFGALSVLVLLVSVAVATLLTRQISRPIRAVSAQTQALAAGDYQQRISVRSRDEIGQLSANFNHLAKTLAANEQSRINWVADISHEMRTPLAVLRAQIEAMQDGVRPMDEHGLALLQQKVAGLNALVDDLFELSLSDIGALNYQMQKLPLAPLVSSSVELFKPQAEAAGLTLRAIVAGGAGPDTNGLAGAALSESMQVLGDHKRLEQLLSNLLQNAIRYTHGPGAIEVELSQTDTHVSLIVRDSAPTVVPEQREKIFERLHRVEKSRNRETGGAGLGLAICKNIVIAHQGQIVAEDSPLGGISIRVKIPRAL